MRSTMIVLAFLCACQFAEAAPGGGGGGGGFPGGGMPSGGPPAGGPPGGGRPGGPSSAPAVQPNKSDYERAEYLIKGQRYEEALPLLLGILRDNPRDADTLNYLGFASRKLGDHKTALDFYQRALAVDPDHKGAHQYLGELYLQMGDVAKAREQLAEVKRICVTNCEEAEDLAADIATYQAEAK